VVEFLPAITPGLTNTEFMAELEHRIETASNALMAEAGFIAPTQGSPQHGH
jgi:1-acyl-sn-glycerol-3-phosphate acyltransferase